MMISTKIGSALSSASRHSSRSFASLASLNRYCYRSSDEQMMTMTPPTTVGPHLPLCQQQKRYLSMAGMPRRGYPQYTMFSSDSALSMKAAMPVFKKAGMDGVAVERRGKMMLEFVPRNASGSGFAWNDKTIFSLTVEEVGLLLSQLPGNAVELSHPTFSSDDGAFGQESQVTQVSGDIVEKVLTVDPGDGATMTFKVDYVTNGVGGQTPPGFDGIPSTPLEITIQAGEFEVLRSIFQTSIPYILGWNTTMDIASAAAISRGLSDGGSMY
mmetsp:Transcript_10107/g.23644  ORF Transcript_10107/g.23644 Transcript_10107/m.23644 type:complete len:270 (-) Transcript_10107:50-859(-)